MRVVLCRGTFDLLHVAHLRHLEEARSWGDALVVSLTPDALAVKEKRQPIIAEHERSEILLGLRCVTGVDICADWRESIEKWLPTIYCKGSDYSAGVSEAERNFCEKHGIHIKFTKPNPQTTSGIIERIKCT